MRKTPGAFAPGAFWLSIPAARPKALPLRKGADTLECPSAPAAPSPPAPPPHILEQ